VLALLERDVDEGLELGDATGEQVASGDGRSRRECLADTQAKLGRGVLVHLGGRIEPDLRDLGHERR
jgi:hypothetical protein